MKLLFRSWCVINCGMGKRKTLDAPNTHRIKSGRRARWRYRGYVGPVRVIPPAVKPKD